MALLWSLLAGSVECLYASDGLLRIERDPADAIAMETEAFLDRCRQQEEIVPDAEYERMFRLCRSVTSADPGGGPEISREKLLLLRLDEVELYTFQAIDGYLGDIEKLRAAQSLLERCEIELNDPRFPKTGNRPAGRSLYLRASIIMLESYHLSHLPRFEEVLPLLKKACDLLPEHPKDVILAMHAMGRAYADLAFADATPEARYEELLEKAESTFREALELSFRQDGFMRTLLMIQLGNTLNNLGRDTEAIETLNAALDRVDPSEEPNRFLALHLDVAQVLAGRYLETLSESDLAAAEKAADRALLVSDSLRSSGIVPHVRFNLAMTLFTIAEEKHDTERNMQAVLELEKVLSVWTFERHPNLHLMATDTLCRFLDLQESMTRDVRYVHRAIALIVGITSRFERDESMIRMHRNVLGNLYTRLSGLYFKRALHETGSGQQEAWRLSQEAERRAEALYGIRP